MTGSRRKRRGSASSVETVDGDQIKWLQESSVVKTVSQTSNRDDWPCFELRDAVVLNKDGKTQENALHVALSGPFIVRGNLYIEETDQQRHLLKKCPLRSSTPIEIRQCSAYALDIPDGRPVVWVSGKGGWYEINPTPSYRHIYSKMCEATTLYYSLLDYYTAKAGKKRKTKNAAAELSEIFFQYAVEAGDGSTLQSVSARCLEHALFFIWHLTVDNSEELPWEKTSFFMWLRKEKPEFVDKVNDMLKKPRQSQRSSSNSNRNVVEVAALPSRTRAKSSVSVSRDSAPEEVDKKDFAPRQLSLRSSSAVQVDLTSPAGEVPSPTPGKSAGQPTNSSEQVSQGDDSAFGTVLAALEWAYDELVKSRNGLTVSGTLNKFYFAYTFPTYKDGSVASHRKPIEEVLHYNAKALLRSIDPAKYERHEIYGWLQQKAQTDFTPVVLKPTDLPFRVTARSRKTKTEQQAAKGAVSFQDSEPHTPARVGKQPSRTPGAKSSLRLAGSSKKRPHAELENDSDTEMSVAKKSHYFLGDDDAEGSAEATSPGNTSSEEDEDSAGDEPIKIVLRAEKIPSTTAHGRDGTWSCEQEGCEHIVRGNDEADCRARIEAHFREHENRSARMDLAVAESSRGHQPINHLLEKIKKLGENARRSEQLTVDGNPLPQPIKRKLIV